MSHINCTIECRVDLITLYFRFEPNFSRDIISNVIPKKIFQTHEWNYQDLPDVFKKTSNTWKNLNPDWEYIYHNKEERSDFILKEFPHLYKIFSSYGGGFQSDVWRYCVVYKYGGVYADMDTVCTKPLNDMLQSYNNEDLIALLQGSGVNSPPAPPTPEEEKHYVNNSNFAAVKNSKVLESVIEDLNLKMIDDLIYHKYQKENVAKRLPYTFYCFAKYASNLEGLVFDASTTSDMLKEEFCDYDLHIGRRLVKYSEYVTKSGLSF